MKESTGRKQAAGSVVRVTRFSAFSNGAGEREDAGRKPGSPPGFRVGELADAPQSSASEAAPRSVCRWRSGSNLPAPGCNLAGLVFLLFALKAMISRVRFNQQESQET